MALPTKVVGALINPVWQVCMHRSDVCRIVLQVESGFVLDVVHGRQVGARVWVVVWVVGVANFVLRGLWICGKCAVVNPLFGPLDVVTGLQTSAKQPYVVPNALIKLGDGRFALRRVRVKAD